MPRAPRNSAAPEPNLNFYGLERLGYADSIPLTGSWLTDQLAIEFMCFRIGLTRSEGGLGKDGHFKAITDLLWNNPELASNKRFIHNAWSQKMIQEACRYDELGIVGSASSGKSDTLSLWCLVNFIADPTHTMVILMSTTLQGAKKRIFKTFREYYDAIPNLPGKPLWSTNTIMGPTYDGTAFGESSGVFLMASEQSSERSALDKLIGIKAPRTGEPNESFEKLKNSPEYADLSQMFDDETLRDLLPRLQNLAHDRIGKLILLIDEATGCAPSILEVYRSNLQPGNVGHCQVIMLGNPASMLDCLGEFCKPAGGWDSVTIMDSEWNTATGGLCVRFDGEQNPRILEKDERLSWMFRESDIQQMKNTYGENSPYYWRMCKGMWTTAGNESGVYSEADMISSGSMNKATWGYAPPTMISAFDPSFAAGGDKASCSFAKIGLDPDGKHIMELVEEIGIQVDIRDTSTPVSYQMVRNWKKECEKRGVRPENAVFDGTGGGGPFGDIVRVLWSPRVFSVNSGGKASKLPIGNDKHPDGTKVLACERMANKATELWMGAMPLMRSGQIKGITTELAKQICGRLFDKAGQQDARMMKVESKRVYRAREGKSPDESDSFFLLVELAKHRHGMKPAERAAVDESPISHKGVGSWKAFCQKARRITVNRTLQ